MKKVKHKLFISYCLTIFIIVSLLSLLIISFIHEIKKRKNIKVIDKINKDIEGLLYNKKDLNLKTIDKHLSLSNEFVFIFKNTKLSFSNQSKYRTYKILDKLNFEYEQSNSSLKRIDQLNKKYKDYYDEEYVEIDGYNLVLNYFKIKNDTYEIYVGIDESYLDQNLDEIYTIVLGLNFLIFLILSFLGYLLINKTISPLKEILDELKQLQKSNDLSKRLKENKTKDEFEELINTFNLMLENIENSVENIKQFSSDASHELRTPLTIIQGQIELIKKNSSKENLVEAIKKIDIEQKKLQEIINTFLLLSKLDKKVYKDDKCFLDKVVFESIEQNIEDIEKKSLELILHISDDIEVNFNEKYLFIVINNLLSNAIKYTKKGSITLIVNENEFVIKDSGMGIAKKDQKRVFERFFRVDKVRTSSTDGIGLDRKSVV